MTLKQIQATQQIMRIAINGQNHVDSLIGYYRDTIDKFNDQRAQWSIYYEACKQNVSNRHLLQREYNQLNGSNIELNTLLSGLKGQLTYQRQKYFHKIQQSQLIKSTLQTNKNRLRQLTEICKPLIMTDKQLSKGNNNNNKMTSIIQQSQSANKSSYSIRTNANNEQQYQQGNTIKQSIFKNDKLTNYNKKQQHHTEQQQQLNTMQTELQLKMINLSKQHQQKKMTLQKHIDELKQDLQQIVSQHSNRRQQCSQQYKHALDKLTDLQSKHHNLVSQFFKYRMTGIEQQQQTQQQNEVIRLKNLLQAQKLKQLQQSHSQQLNSVENEVKQRNKQFRVRYDEELRKKQEHLSILKQQHERIADIYLNKLKKMQQQLRTTSQRTKIIEQKTKTQVSSLKSQIKILTNRLDNVAMKQMKADLVPRNGVDEQQESEDDSSVTLQMEELDRINREVKDLQKELDHNGNKKNKPSK